MPAWPLGNASAGVFSNGVLGAGAEVDVESLPKFSRSATRATARPTMIRMVRPMLPTTRSPDFFLAGGGMAAGS
jgi:hypothetical protein